jgi:hypothetical protein
MKTLEEIRAGLWFYGPSDNKSRLDERDWKKLIAVLEAGGWVLVPKEPTERMIEAAWRKQVADSGVPKDVYAAMIEARPGAETKTSGWTLTPGGGDITVAWSPELAEPVGHTHSTEQECVLESRAMDGGPYIGGHGRAWCRVHGFDCPKLKP